MNWWNSLRDQLPLLLVLSPVIGFVVTYAAAKTQPDLVRTLAVSNSCCSFLILVGIVWQFQVESADLRTTLRVSQERDAEGERVAGYIEAVQDQLDKQRAERIRLQFFDVDGLNLWPTIVLIVLTGTIVWMTDGPSVDSSRFLPMVILFEALCVASLTSCDLRGFLLASGTAGIVMSLLIGTYGGSERRILAERFLMAQFAGNAAVTLGFAMLVVSVSWMKIEVSTTFPTISSNIAMLVYETQKWASRNQLAYQYENEVFPWMLLILSVGFAIQFGLFPFHSWQVSLLSETRREIAVLCLAGTLSVAWIGWQRFVLPLAPDLLVGYGPLILVPSVGGAVWGSLRSRIPCEPRRRIAFVYLGLTGVSLLGCYCFTTIGMCGAWIMQQQLIVVVCATILFGEQPSFRTPDDSGAEHNDFNKLSNRSRSRPQFSTRTLLLMLCVPALGLFAASSMIVSELLRESLSLVTTVFVVGMVVIRTLHSVLCRHELDETQSVENTPPDSGSAVSKRDRWPLIVVGLLAIVVNLFPSWMLHQCEPEFHRVFRQYERSLAGH